MYDGVVSAIAAMPVSPVTEGVEPWNGGLLYRPASASRPTATPASFNHIGRCALKHLIESERIDEPSKVWTEL